MKLKLGYRNSRRVLNVMAAGLLLVSAILLGFPKPVVAADPTFDFVLPAGLACSDFDLQITGWGEGSQVYKEFVDENGNVVRILSAGTGYELLFTNVLTGSTFSTKSNGAVNQTKINPDGSSTVTVLGHNLLILFPTDVPPGPSTTLYVGQVIYTTDLSGVFTLQKVSGRAIDICAALSD